MLTISPSVNSTVVITSMAVERSKIFEAKPSPMSTVAQSHDPPWPAPARPRGHGQLEEDHQRAIQRKNKAIGAFDHPCPVIARPIGRERLHKHHPMSSDANSTWRNW